MEAIVNCLLATRDSAVEFNTNTLYEVIWTISDLFDEINSLQKQSSTQKEIIFAPGGTRTPNTQVRS